ncbi:rhomboid family protein [Phlyctema vagabunda]|uniref:Rhomboid family protein n=1 Tax=Phlyctema vagabunda TaxID=108571 RepID=A0ABR4PXQ7_9HELO
MNFLCPTISRTPCLSSRSLLRSCREFDSLAARLAQRLQRSYSIHTAPLRRGGEIYRPALRSCHTPSPISGRLQIRAFASARVVTRWEDLPAGYKEDQGLAFGTKPLSKEQIWALFGKGMNVQEGNRLLQVLHGRRVAGSLKEPDYILRPGHNERAHRAGLAWLRKNIPVDEDYSEGMRAEQELLAMGLDVDGAETSYEPNNKPVTGEGGVYGLGALERVRRAKEAAWEAEQAARKKREEEAGIVSGGLQTADGNGVVLRTPGQNPKLQYYLERAKVLPDILPNMTIFQRLWPSAVFSLVFVGGVLLLASIYIPPGHSARMMPSLPPAAATVGLIIACNTLVFVLWHVPPAFRLLEKYFIAVPGYPRALSMLGNTFSHKSFSHLAVNMIGLWFAGTRLHDDVGRANFLAIYLCSGVLGSFFSLTTFVVRSHFISSSLGASGAVMGVAAAYLWLYHDENMKFFNLPPDPWQGIPASVLLALLFLGEVLSVWRGRKANAFLHDHAAHLGGAVTGLVGGHIVRRKMQERQRLEQLRRKNLSVIDRIKEGRL